MKTLFGKEKPWVLLGISRKEYEGLRLWKKTKLPRNEFDLLLASLPDGFFKDVKLRVDVTCRHSSDQSILEGGSLV